MSVSLGRLVIYTHKMAEMEAFYCTHFGFTALHDPKDRIVELHPSDGGAAILLHPASKRQKMGQVLVKLAFQVADVPAFCEGAKEVGFGAIHQADGYAFANAKDPSGNSISVSSRAFRDKD